MARQRSAEDLSVEELRYLLVHKRRAERQRRLDHYRRTGRVIRVEPQPRKISLESLSIGSFPDADDEAVSSQKQGSKRRLFTDRLLFLVEVAAVCGLLFILISGINVLRDLNREMASVLEQPTLTPTPLIMAVVLPSGHTPPNAPGGVQPNEAEIPEHLRPLVQSLADLPVPTPGPEQAVRIQIPAIGVDAPVVQGDGWEQLKKGVAQHLGTPNPGQNGNLVLSAHNDVFGEIFRDLDRLKEGDQIVVFTSQRTFTYIIKGTQIIEPIRVDVIAPTREAVVTLVSCYPYMVDNKRIVVTAYLQG